MFDLSVKNISGDVLQLTRNSNYVITGITGLTPVAANINTSTAGINDGVLYNSARLGYRNIVITVHLTNDIEKNRIKLYDFFQTKQFCTLYFSNDSRNVSISGYVETFDCDLFSISETAQISIICPNPYFQSVSETINSIETDIFNAGDVPTGMDIVINFIGDVKNPVIQNTITNEFFRLNSTFVSGDKVTINTHSGEKSVILTHTEVDFNIINAVDDASSWLQLKHGNNELCSSADSGMDNMMITVAHIDLFVGV